MKRVLKLAVFALFFMPVLQARSSSCPNPETIQRLQELQRCIDTIKSKVTDIQNQVISLDTQIDIIATISGLDDLESQISASDVLLCSKIEDLSELVSINDDLILSSIDEHASATDALVCSKVGDLDDFGTCLETLIDLPDDIDNLNLNVIELLKTILLELRGCNQC